MMRNWNFGPGYYDSGANPGLVYFAFLPMLLMLIVVILFVAALIKYLKNNPNGYGEKVEGRPKAEEIIKTRYAKGEVGRKEYEEMMDDLKK